MRQKKIFTLLIIFSLHIIYTQLFLCVRTTYVGAHTTKSSFFVNLSLPLFFLVSQNEIMKLVFLFSLEYSWQRIFCLTFPTLPFTFCSK